MTKCLRKQRNGGRARKATIIIPYLRRCETGDYPMTGSIGLNGWDWRRKIPQANTAAPTIRIYNVLTSLQTLSAENRERRKFVEIENLIWLESIDEKTGWKL